MLSSLTITLERQALSTLAAIAVACATAVVVRRRWSYSKYSSFASLPRPPGPRRLPVIGNLLQLPQIQPWEEYSRMSKQYGDIMYLEALGQPIIVLNSLEKAAELFDKRGAVFSGRAALPTIELIGLTWTFGLMDYGAKYKRYRKPLHQHINSTVLPKFYPVFNEEVLLLLRNLEASPGNFRDHLEFFFEAVIMRISYGFDDIEKNKALIGDATFVVEAFSEATISGRYLVNSLPWLKHVPSWFPGAGWKKHLESVATVTKRVCYDSFEAVKENRRKGIKSKYPNLATILLEDMPEELSDEERELLEDIARGACATGHLAGADTTISAALGLVYIMAKYPEVQKRLQDEIDQVTEGKRLPLMSDRASLPYVNAVLSELSRWYTIVPLGLPHMASEDTEYDGYFIPKGSIVMCNTCRSIAHDPEIWENPMEFNPDRFMKDGKYNSDIPGPVATGTFGYGRRLCPGRALASDSLFLAAVSLLSVFDISPPLDEVSGKPIPMPKFEILDGTIASPIPFDIRITPRSEVQLDGIR